MISETLKRVMEKEGVVTIVAQGKDFPRVVNTWHSYVRLDDGCFILPVCGMRSVEEALTLNDKVLVTVGSKEVEGLHGMGTGFLLTGRANITQENDTYASMKETYPWARAVMVIQLTEATQTV